MKRNQKFQLVLAVVGGVLLPGFALAQSLLHPIPITSCTSTFDANMAGAYYQVTGNLSAASGDCIDVTPPT